jgi:5-(carboxyamino)imidazole ribonucleotide mutase
LTTTNKRTRSRVAILMGSDSDWPIMSAAASRLDALGIPCEAHVLSAHRSPDATARFARGARAAGIEVLICGAGAAAHLAGAVAAQTTLPVIGVPLDASGMGGLDALLATVQMPPGVPVATVAVGKFGAENAAVLAAQILAVADTKIAARLEQHKQTMARGVADKDAKLQKERSGARRSAEPHETRGGVREGRTARGDA